jgi:hypothetical protein
MLNESITRLLMLSVSLWGCCAVAQQPDATVILPHDQVQDCLRKVWGKPVFWDSSSAYPPVPSICSMPAEKLDDALKARHLKAFHLPNAVLLTSDDAFTPNRMNLYYRWKTPSLSIRVQALTLPDSRKPTDAEMRQIADVILQRSHLVPLACPYDSGPDGVGKLAVTIDIDIHKMHPGSQQESAIALVIDTDPEHDHLFGAGRIVFGELGDGGYKYLWETPMLASSYGRWGYVDLLRNGNLQIDVTSAWGNNMQYTVFYDFDLDGSEITRQSDTCTAMDALAIDHNRNAAVCPMYGDAAIVEGGKGPKEMVITDEKGKKVRYAFSDGRYQRIGGSKKPAPPSDPVATARNKEGMQLMEQKDYEGAMAKFAEAAVKNSDDPIFANNAGFAYYKMGKYEDSLYWYDKTIEIDPERAVAYLNLGDSLAKLKRNADARKAYAKYLELAPESKAAPDVKKKLEALPPSP